MCNPISAVLTKESVYFGDTDSHEAILEQHRLHEGTGLRPNILRVEVRPQRDGSWHYVVDQDVVPVWHDHEEDEKRARGAVERSGIGKLYADYEAKRAALYADSEAKCAALYAGYKAKRHAIAEQRW